MTNPLITQSFYKNYHLKHLKNVPKTLVNHLKNNNVNLCL